MWRMVGFDQQGKMITGWFREKYYFRPDGVMAADEFWDGCYFDKDGVWDLYKYTWIFKGNNWYNTDVDHNDVVVKSKTVLIDGSKCTFDEDGRLIK